MAAEAPAGQMSFLAHLEELRRRLLRCVIAIALAFLLCYAFSGPILRFFLEPIRVNLFAGGEIVYRQLTEPFLIYLKVSLLAAFFVASPYVFWEIWRFVSPGLLPGERKWALPFLLGAPGLFISGGLFGYYVLLPLTCRFLVGIGGDYRALLDLRSAFAFEAWLLLGLGIVFQIPVLAAALARAGLISAGWLWRQFRFAVLGIFVLAAVLTPSPDVVTQIVFATPMILLYLASIGIAALVGRR